MGEDEELKVDKFRLFLTGFFSFFYCGLVLKYMADAPWYAHILMVLVIIVLVVKSADLVLVMARQK